MSQTPISKLTNNNMFKLEYSKYSEFIDNLEPEPYCIIDVLKPIKYGFLKDSYKLHQNIKIINNATKNIIWKITETIDNSFIMNEGYKFSVPEKTLNFQLKIKGAPRKIGIFYDDNVPQYFIDFNGNTFKDFMNSIYNSLGNIIPYSDNEYINKFIANISCKVEKEELIFKYENNNLTVFDIFKHYGDIVFAGELRIEEFNGEKVWTYSTYSTY